MPHLTQSSSAVHLYLPVSVCYFTNDFLNFVLDQYIPMISYPYAEHAGLIVGLRPANERHRYKVTPSLIGWVQTQNQPWHAIMLSDPLFSLHFIIHCLRFISTFPICFHFNKELRSVTNCMLSRAAILVPFFTALKLVAYLMLMAFSLSGNLMASDTIFMTIGLCDAVITSVTLEFPSAILLMSTAKIKVSRVQLIKVLQRPSAVKLLMINLILLH